MQYNKNTSISTWFFLRCPACPGRGWPDVRPDKEKTDYNGPKNLDTKTGGLKTQMSVRKKYPADFKTKIVLEILKEEKSLSQISSEYGIHTTQLNRWKKQALEGLPQLFTDERKSLDAIRTGYEKQIQDLYAEVGRLTTQLNWLKKKSGL
jgi:transposase-like protein